MENRITYGDVATISALSAAIGGFLSAAVLVGLMYSQVGWIDQPLAALGSMVFAGFLGVVVALLTAWPVGFIFGSFILKFAGSTMWHAAFGGAATAFTMFAAALYPELAKDVGLLGFAVAYAVAGGFLAAFARWYLMSRVAVFGNSP